MPSNNVRCIVFQMTETITNSPFDTMASDALVIGKSEVIEFHEREAARLRQLLANATTPALRARLLQQAQKHERFGGTARKDQSSYCRPLGGADLQ